MIKKIDVSPLDKNLFARVIATAPAQSDIEADLSDYSKVVVKKPWGYEYLIFGSEEIAVWILCLKHGAQTSMHCHPRKKTSLVVLEGEVICSTVSEELRCVAGQGLLLDKAVFHQTTAVAESGAYVMEIETPVDKRDLVRLKDRYGRERQGYETPDQYSGNLQNYNYVSLDQHGSIPYNRKKRFGECTLTFQRVEDPRHLQELVQLNPEDVVCVLKGRLLDGRGGPAFEVGDTVTIRDLAQVAGLSAGSGVELLVIKRIDTLIKVSDYVAHFLRRQRVKEIFLVPGEATVHLLDSIGRTEGLSFICCQSERSASLAAEGYAKVNSDLAVLVISSGGSGLSVLPGVGNAWIDSAPMLILSGQTRTDQYAEGRLRQLDNKSLNIVDIVRPITKYAVRIDDPTTIQSHLTRAVALATEGRPGPVWVDLPIDIQGMTIDASDLKPPIPSDGAARVEETTECIPTIVQLLQQAKRPVLLVGSGIRIAKVQQELFELIDRLRVPVLTSRRGADVVPEAHPFFFGRPGVYGQRRANFIIQNADLLLAIGCRLSIPLISRNYKAFARAAKKIIVDVDPEEVRKPTITPDLAVRMDAKRFVSELLRHLDGYTADHTAWLVRCQNWAKRFPPLGSPVGEETQEMGQLRLLPHQVVSALADVMGPDEILVIDGGSPVHKVMQSFRVKARQRLISSTGLELPGFALAGAIGASANRGRTAVLCLSEDRGFYGETPNLQTMVDYHLPIKMFVFRTRGNSNIRKIQRDYFGERYVGTDQEIRVGAPDLTEIARAYGIEAFVIDRADEMGQTIERVLRHDGPALCAIEVEDDQDVMPRSGFIVTEDGRWIARPIEDQYPYLTRETLKENMLIPLVEVE